MTKFGLSPLRHILLGLLMLAMTSLPFAHRAGAAPVDVQIAQFIAAGGALSDICGDMGTHIAGGCESCRITPPLLVPAAAHILRPLLRPTLLKADYGIRRPAPLLYTQITPPVRAPPKI
jgi:hypothetical protein